MPDRGEANLRRLAAIATTKPKADHEYFPPLH
jgi:hypothetical protein